MPRNFNVLRDKKVRAKLIALIAEGIGVTYAAKQVGSDRRMVFKYRKEDTAFDEAYREAYIFSVESAIGEAKMALENADLNTPNGKLRSCSSIISRCRRWKSNIKDRW